MLTLDDLFKMIEDRDTQPVSLIVRLRYKYSFEKEYTEENELLSYYLDRNGDPVFVWDNDWDEGQTSNGEVYVMHGRWIVHTTWNGMFGLIHSECKFDRNGDLSSWKHCPNCGSRMNGGI